LSKGSRQRSAPSVRDWVITLCPMARKAGARLEPSMPLAPKRITVDIVKELQIVN